MQETVQDDENINTNQGFLDGTNVLVTEEAPAF